MNGSWEMLVSALQVGAVLAVVALPRALFAREQHRRLWSLVGAVDDEPR